MRRAADILDYWLGPQPERDAPAEAYRRRWFEKSDATDEYLREHFGQDVARAAAGDYDGWVETPRGRLAAVILLDQFTRNIFRGSGRMFENDRKALALARSGIDLGEDRRLLAAERQFLYMPLMHAESLELQERSYELFEALAQEHPTADSRRWAESHRAIIERFGRFPHRNALLNRTSTEQERDFLTEPGSSF